MSHRTILERKTVLVLLACTGLGSCHTRSWSCHSMSLALRAAKCEREGMGVALTFAGKGCRHKLAAVCISSVPPLPRRRLACFRVPTPRKGAFSREEKVLSVSRRNTPRCSAAAAGSFVAGSLMLLPAGFLEPGPGGCGVRHKGSWPLPAQLCPSFSKCMLLMDRAQSNEANHHQLIMAMYHCVRRVVQHWEHRHWDSFFIICSC